MRISDLTDPILQLICDYLSDRDLIAIIQVTPPPFPTPNIPPHHPKTPISKTQSQGLQRPPIPTYISTENRASNHKNPAPERRKFVRKT